MTKRTPPYSPEVRERAVRMVFDHQGEHASQYEAIRSIAQKIGCSGETLRNWVRQAERDQGSAPARRPMSASASRRSSGRTANCARPTRSCARRRPILPRRSSTAGSSHDRLHRRSSRASTGSSRSAKSCRSPRRRTTPMPPGGPIRTAARRAKRDEALKHEIRRVFEENFRVYGVRKVWRQLAREGIAVARCTVARLMRAMGLQGAVRGKPARTTVSDKAAPCPLDRVNRQFRAPRPNALWVVRLHLCRDLGGLRLCRLRDRRLCPPHRRLAGVAHGPRRLRARCARAGPA